MKRPVPGTFDSFSMMTLVTVAIVTVDVLMLWCMEGVVYDRYIPLTEVPEFPRLTLWLFVALGGIYGAWSLLLARCWLTPLGGTGFVIAALGVWLRFVGDNLYAAPNPVDFSGEGGFQVRVITAAEGFENVTMIVATARLGGLAAYVIGLVMVVVIGGFECRARFRVRKRLYRKAIEWPRWF